MRSLSTWMYDKDPLMPLRFEAPLTAVKLRLTEDSTYLQQLLRSYLLDNDHRVTTILEPDPTLNQRQEEEERQKLDAVRAELSADELATIVDETRTLKALQETTDSPETLALLPTLKLEDLEPHNKEIPSAITSVNGTTVLYHDLFTNGIVYLDLAFDLRKVPLELLPYAKFFSKALTQMGTTSEDFVKLSQRIDRQTGGIYASNFVASAHMGTDIAARMMLHGKSTVEQTGDMLAIMRDILLTVDLDDQERFRQIVLRTKAQVESGLVPSGTSYVASRLSAGYSTAGWINEQLSGVDYLFFVRQLADQVENDWPSVVERLAEVRQLLVDRDNLLCNLTIDEANRGHAESKLAELLATLPQKNQKLQPWAPTLLSSNEGLTIPAQVNYVGKAVNLYSAGYKYHGSVNVISNLIRTGYLWDKIRVQGGAYGAFCRFGKQSGVISFLSYRDPNLAGTLENYDAVADFLRKEPPNADELRMGIIGAIGSMDAYQLPDAKGRSSMTRYLLGETDETRQITREQILSTGTADINAFAAGLDALPEQGRVVVVGSAEALNAAVGATDPILEIHKVL